MMGSDFGELLKSLRKEKNVSLREFSRKIGKDAGNISKMERGLIPPPNENIVLEYAKVLGFNEEDEKIKKLLSLAAVEKKKIPKKVLEDKELMEKLPLFFRTATGSKPERDKIINFLENLKKI